jgi:hypothetical protein
LSADEGREERREEEVEGWVKETLTFPMTSKVYGYPMFLVFPT